MPSQKPRLNLTLPDSLNLVITELAELQGIPKTKVITDLLLEVEPMLKQASDALKLARDNKQDAIHIAKSYAETSILDANEKLGLLSAEVKKL